MTEAHDLYTRDLEVSETTAGPESLSAIISMSNLARFYQETGRLDQAEKLFRASLATSERAIVVDHPHTIGIRHSLSNLLTEQERFHESIPLRRKQLQSYMSVCGSDDENTLDEMHSLANDLYCNGETEESWQLLSKELEARVVTYGEDNSSTIRCRAGLALALGAMGKFDEAVSQRGVVLEWLKRDDVVFDNSVIELIECHGCDLIEAEKIEEALAVFEQCLEKRRESLGFADTEMQLLLSNVQECLRALELHEEAIKLTSEAYKDIAQKLGINSPEALDQIQIQASLHVKINQMENAETLYQQCLVGHEQSLGLNHSVTLNTAYLLADVLTRQGRHGEAIPLRRRHLEGQRKQNMDRNEETMTAAVELAIDLFKEGQYEEAEINLKCVLTVLEGLDAPSEPELWFVLSMLSQVLDNNDRVEEAIKFTRRTIQCLTDDEDPDRQLVNHERVVLSRQLAEIGNIEEAIQQLQEVISTLSNNPKAVDEDLELLNDAEELRRQIAEEA